jgi:transcriptional regulator with XRE-family HTH domain
MENALAVLVTAHCERTGDTLTDIAARGGLSRQTLSGLVHRNGPKSMPRQQTLEALAKGLGVSVEAVRQVAATATYGPGDGPQVRRLVATLVGYAETLDDGQLEVVLATARALQRMVTPV